MGWGKYLKVGLVLLIAGFIYFGVFVDSSEAFVDRETGCLEITKGFDAPDGVELPPEVTVMIWGPSYPGGDEVTLSAKNDYLWEKCGLIPGEYKIEELDIPGWTTTYSPGQKVEVVADQTAGVKILNTFDTGCLVLQKGFDAPDGVEDLVLRLLE